MVYDIKKDCSTFVFLKYENSSLFYNLILNFWGNSYAKTGVSPKFLD